MSRFQLRVLSALPILLSGAAIAPAAAANEAMQQITEYSNSAPAVTMGQVTSVSQLSDVRPTDWAFQALQSLVERYGCIAGYPDRTYRGNRAMTRYEFAAGLNACMDRVNELIAAATNDMASKEDLATLQRLQEEFASELAEIRGKVDALEAKTATLEKQQFSTTTKLNGEVIFSVAGVLGDNRAVATGSSTADLDDQTTFSNRVRLTLDTSFTGKDRLRTRLEAGNIPGFDGATGTRMARLSYETNNGNNVEIDELYYRFPLGDKLTVQVDATNMEFYDALITPLSPFDSSGSGAITRYGRFTPNLRAGVGGAGVSARFKLNDKFRIEAGYIAGNNDESNDPADKQGIFDGSNKLIAQLVVSPIENLEIAAAYGRSYYGDGEVNLTASTGSGFSRRPFGNVATTADEISAQATYKLTKNIKVGGWYGIQLADEVNGGGEATVQNWAAFAEIKDAFTEGGTAGLIFGVPPKVTNTDGTLARLGRDDDTSYHLEGFYKYKLNDNITITPGLAVIFNPEHNSNNDTIFVGAIRTTFKF